MKKIFNLLKRSRKLQLICFIAVLIITCGVAIYTEVHHPGLILGGGFVGLIFGTHVITNK